MKIGTCGMLRAEVLSQRECLGAMAESLARAEERVRELERWRTWSRPLESRLTFSRHEPCRERACLALPA